MRGFMVSGIMFNSYKTRIFASRRDAQEEVDTRDGLIITSFEVNSRKERR